MLFEKMLIHRCTLINEGVVIGRDDYGRDILKESKQDNVPCRFDEVRQTVRNDDTGFDFIYQNALYFDKDIEISLSTEIRDIRDQFGMVIMAGSHSISRLVPIYDSSSLHHWEAIIQQK